MRRVVFGIFIVLGIVLLTGLGLWQVQRLAWKTELIARVNARVTAPAVPAPPVTATVTAKADEYRHVTVHGRFLNMAEAQVYTVSDYGGGYWVMTPLQRDDGSVIFINRGFVPLDKQDPKTRAAGNTGAEVAVTGLLRMPETKGWLFSQANDPAHDRWYRRDIAAIAATRHLGPVAPYFIDADATPNPGGWPKGGLTVIRFPNSHLMYAITWFSMALGLAGVSAWLMWFRKPEAD
ncbi:MAG: SURF1 family protein [Asticcacaulis sp.]|nr:SURF1 family protein [Asticcacaulis sp.]